MSTTESLDGKEAYKQTCEVLSRPPCNLHALTSLFPDRVFFYGDEGHGIILNKYIAYITAESAEGLYYSGEEIKLRDCGNYKRLINPDKIWRLRKIPKNLINEVVSDSKKIRVACEEFYEDQQ